MKTIAMDLGGSRVKMGVVSQGKVECCALLDSNSTAGLVPLLPKLEEVCRQWIQREPVDGLGIAFPSLVDVDRKKILGHNGKFPDYAQVDLERWAWEKFELPLVLENDANAAALGEGAFGSAAGVADFVLMTLGTGIGTAAVMGGQLVRGRHYQAGNMFGHLPLKVNGRKCKGCPGVGCAEAQASTWALPLMVAESERDSPLKREPLVDFKVLQHYVSLGDPLALSLFEECCSYWVNCLLAMVYAYDPELIVLSGGVMNWGPQLADRLVGEVEERVWTPWGRLRFCLAQNPEHSVLLGLHALCLKEHGIPLADGGQKD